MDLVWDKKGHFLLPIRKDGWHTYPKFSIGNFLNSILGSNLAEKSAEAFVSFSDTPPEFKKYSSRSTLAIQHQIWEINKNIISLTWQETKPELLQSWSRDVVSRAYLVSMGDGARLEFYRWRLSLLSPIRANQKLLKSHLIYIVKLATWLLQA